MREIFSVRFFAAVLAVVGLLVVLRAVLGGASAPDGESGDPGRVERRIDLVEQVFASTDPAFAVVDGVANDDTDLVIDARRRLRIVAGTPGESQCDVLGPATGCAVVADLLGEGVVWFALVPNGPAGTVPFPAIDTLDDGLATLVNGWRLPYAPVLDRRCRDGRGRDVEFASYREFRDELGAAFTSVYDTTERRLVAVECDAPPVRDP